MFHSFVVFIISCNLKFVNYETVKTVTIALQFSYNFINNSLQLYYKFATNYYDFITNTLQICYKYATNPEIM